MTERFAMSDIQCSVRRYIPLQPSLEALSLHHHISTGLYTGEGAWLAMENTCIYIYIVHVQRLQEKIV